MLRSSELRLTDKDVAEAELMNNAFSKFAAMRERVDSRIEERLR